jgi:hypothetical protein
MNANIMAVETVPSLARRVATKFWDDTRATILPYVTIMLVVIVERGAIRSGATPSLGKRWQTGK